MSDSMKFTHVDKPASVGTSCWTCLTHAHPGGFFQVNKPAVPVPGFGLPALCAGCVHELANAAGCLDPAQKDVLHGQLHEMSAAIESLHVSLEAARTDKYVPLAQVLDFFEERAKRRPDEPKPATEPEPTKVA